MAKKTSRDGDSHHFTTISLADLIQVGGVILGILSAFVFAATARARLVTILIVCATVLLCGVLYLLFVKHAGWRSLRLSMQILLSVILVAAAAVYANSPAQATGSADSPGGGMSPGYPSAGPGGTPVPSIEKNGYVLKPSSFIDTNEQDKVDLDTGCPGWGAMHPHIGPSRCGELADLIIDPDSLHNADGPPSIIGLLPGTSGTYSSCHALLTATPSTSVSSIQASSLRDGEVLCVMTDLQHIAVVHFDKVIKDNVGQLTSVTIDFQVWTVQQ